MAQDNQLDGVFLPLRLPFDTILSDLDSSPRLIDGLNTQVTTGGFIKKRGGLAQVTEAGTIGTGKRIDRLYNYTTMEATPKTYVMASVLDIATSRWSVYYTRPGNTTAWTQITSLRDVNTSTRPHEMAESRGLLYIKGYPDSGSSEKLGTVVFNGKDLSVKPWGALGPDTPARMSNQYKTTDPLYSAWTPSAHPFTVNYGWEYVYAYKSSTGHITNRSQVETNQDFPASNTGAFSNLKPRVVVKVPSDVTNFPTIIIYRKSDGGGTWYKVEEIDVSGETPGSSYTYEDNSLTSGIISGTASSTLNGGITNVATSLIITAATDFPYRGSFAIKIDSEFLLVTGVSGTTFTVTRGFGGTTAASHSNGATIEYFGLDPLPDSKLDQGDRAASLTSNSPPPTVLAEEGGIVGTTTPEASTPIVKFAGRLWYGVGNVLFYNALEELDSGIPEEAWPSGLNGNFFRFQEPLVALAATAESLYIWTTRRTYWLKGFDRTSFTVQPLFTDLGAKDGYAVAVKGDLIYWVSNNNRIFRAKDNQKEPIGDPLGSHLEARLSPSNGVSNLRMYMAGLQVGEIDWLVLQLVNVADSSLSATYVFDLQQEGLFWQTPWDFPISCLTSGQVYETDSKDFLVGATWNRSTNTLALCKYDDDAIQDYVPAASQNYAVSLKTSLAGVPTGNNVNTYKKPTFTPLLYGFVLERKKFTSDTQPTVTFYLDSVTDSYAGGTAYDTPRRDQATDYLAYKYSDNIYRQTERASVKIDKAAIAEDFEIHGLRWIWEFSGGVGY